MDMSLQKRVGPRPLAVLVTALACAVCCMVLADVSTAAVPKGLNCVASDGKINGRGSTFQKKLQAGLAELYRDDFCGNTPKVPEDPAGNTMVAYNYAAAEGASGTGSGQGVKAASCRTDAFSGTDIPYSTTQLKELDEAPGKTGGCGITFTPPFQPNEPKEWPYTASGKKDTTANVMSVPVAGSSVTVDVNLTAANCGGTAPTELNFTAREVSRLFGGEVKKWNDSELEGTDPVLKNCNTNVTRVVRFDESGTSTIFKSYLIRADNERSGAACAPGKKWEAYFAKNNEWPGKQSPGAEGECSAITTAGVSGGPALITKLKETEGGVGYADLADAIGKGVLLANVQNSTATSFQPPNTGSGANCDYKTLTLPGATASDAVGLNGEGDTWANNQETNHGNATDVGSKYPICGLTWDLVYTGLSSSAGENPISRLTADQRRTEYSYFTFLLSSTAQEALTSINYAALPSAWLPKLKTGFQSNF